MTSSAHPSSGVAAHTLVLTMLAATVTSAFLIVAATLVFAVGFDLSGGQSNAGSFGDLLLFLVLSSTFVGAVILVPMMVVGIPMAVIFDRNQVALKSRIAVSGISALCLGQLIGGLTLGAGGAIYGAICGVLSAWVWLAMLAWASPSRPKTE